MADVIKKIRTPDGDLPIDYAALANLPELGELAAKDKVTRFDLSVELQAAVDNATTVTDFADGGTMNGNLTVNGELTVDTHKFSLSDASAAGGGVAFDNEYLSLTGFNGVDITAYNSVTVGSNTEVTITAPKIEISNGDTSSNGAITFDKNSGIRLLSLHSVELSTAGSIDLNSAGPIYLSGLGTNIEGDVAISGNLTVAGESIESSLENVVTPQNTITLRDGTTTSLLSGEYTGIIAEKYDGTHNGMLVFDKDGTAYVGDEGDVQPLATRDLTSEDNGSLIAWNEEKQTLVSSNVKADAENQSIVINEGEATGKYAIAGGSTDKTVINNLLGSLATTQVSLEAPKALAPNSISLGSGTVVNSVGGNAIGVWNTVGCKGYYWKELTNTAGATTSTFALSSTQPALLGSWEAVTSVDWQVGDTICVIDEAHFPFCATITAIGTTQIGTLSKKTTVTITTTKLPFDGEASPWLTTPQNKSICAFYQKTEISAADNKRWLPRNGAVEMGWGATAFGIENLNTGSASFATGWNNWQASSFGLTAGRENISGYSDITGGVFNENNGESSVVAGKSNINKVKSVGNIIGGHTNDNTGHNSLVVGARNIVKPGQYASDLEGDHVVAGADNNVTGWNNIVAGHHNDVDSSNAIVSGYYADVYSSTALAIGNGYSTKDDNGKETITRKNSFYVRNDGYVNAQGNIYSAGTIHAKNSLITDGYIYSCGDGQYCQYSLISGDSNKNNAGYANFMVGSRNELLQDSNYSYGGQHVISGADNQVYGSWNSMVGGQKNKVRHSGCLVMGEGNSTSRRNQLVAGEFANPSGSALLTVGTGSEGNLKNAFEVLYNPSTKVSSIKIGNTEITEAQLKKLIEFIDSVELS